MAFAQRCACCLTIALGFGIICSAEVRHLQSGAGPQAWQNDLTPIAASDWNYERAAHLLERAGFGGTPEEIDRLVKVGPKGAVDFLVDYEKIANPAPKFDESGIYDAGMLPDVDYHFADFTDGLRAGMTRGVVYGVKANPDGVRRYQPIIDMLYYRGFSNAAEWRRAAEWWAGRMLTTKRPLEEKLTLFWHGHFATENNKVDDYRLMLQQIEMLRAGATGNFRNQLLGIARDPAMLIYLDNRKNVKGKPNENFAREIMELFSLGVGNYTEHDIKEAARAFTGWDNRGLQFAMHEDLHDNDPKTVLGKTGNFSGEDIVDILLEQKACAQFMSRKMYRYLVREDASPELQTKLAALLRSSHYEWKPFLRTIFLSRDFYSPASFATQIKSPVVYMVSTYKKMGLTSIPGTPYFATVMANLGQNLGNPPNVKGWDGGRAWVNPSTLLQRCNVVRHVLFPDDAVAEYPRDTVPARYANAKKEAEERDRMLAGGQTAAPMAAKTSADGGDGATMSAPLMRKIGNQPNYDLKLGVYNGQMRTHERVKPTPPDGAKLDLAGIVRSAGAATPADVVDSLTTRFMSQPLAASDRRRLVEYAAKHLGAKIDYSSASLGPELGNVLYMVLSMPEYQLN